MSDQKDLSFSNNDPGTAKFGNFINYYSFHSSKERINNLQPEMFPLLQNDEIFCLDIGCNTGELTNDVYVYMESIYPYSKIKILAIDIDPILIKRAQEKNTNSNTTFMTSDITTECGQNIIKTYLSDRKLNTFDVIFCFSVTMWIHINNGDEELEKFLSFLKENSKAIIIEPQPWKCYKNAQRRMKRSGKSFALFDTLVIRDNVDKAIENIILNDKSYTKVHESSSSWERRIQSYHKK